MKGHDEPYRDPALEALKQRKVYMNARHRAEDEKMMREIRGTAGTELDRLASFLQARFPGAYCHLPPDGGDDALVDLAIQLLHGLPGDDT